MVINADILHTLTKGSPEQAWQVIMTNTLEIATNFLAKAL